jgi:hypothetical protein
VADAPWWVVSLVIFGAYLVGVGISDWVVRLVGRVASSIRNR